jgi:hypothetical protein
MVMEDGEIVLTVARHAAETGIELGARVTSGVVT